MDNTAVTDEANEQLGNEYRRKSHGSPEMFSTSVMRGVIRRRSSYKAEGVKEYQANKRIHKAVKKAQEDRMGI